MQAHAASAVTVRAAASVRGRLRVPGDKSISHRYAILAALADGPSRIAAYSPGADCASTVRCLRALGVAIHEAEAPAHGMAGSAISTLRIDGRGPDGLVEPGVDLDAGNSGTTLRMMAGVLAARPFTARLVGDASLSRRPMRRIIDPLRMMGADIRAADGDRPPLTIGGAALSGVDYSPPVASAQVKSAILLAGLQAHGRTIVRERSPTRDHTERAFRAFGVGLDLSESAVAIDGGQRPVGTSLRVPGDLSSAAFWIVAAAALSGSDVEIVEVGLNPTRTALLDLLAEAGGHVEHEVTDTDAGEPRGTVRVRPAPLRSLTIAPAAVPGLIDELPVLAVLGTRVTQVTVRGAADLRAKESDRISALVAGLRTLGADIEEFPDGFRVRPTPSLRGGQVDAAGDHRLAMSFAIAGLWARGPVTIVGAEVVEVSYPGFFQQLGALCGAGALPA
jgi:3-phosphoshikimate 1-carboxyvinyltransferase